MSPALPTSDPKTVRLLQDAAALHRDGNLHAAEVSYRKALKLRPRDPDALHLLGVLLGQRGDPREGVKSIKQALAIRDNFPDAHANAALLYWQNLGDLASAEHHARRAVSYRPTPRSYCDLGNILRAAGKQADAMAAFRMAMECNPRAVEGYEFYARALRVANDFPAMLSVARAGLALDPQNPALHLISAEAYFGLGRLKEGWNAYRWRFKAPENKTAPKPYHLPAWEGESLAGHGILVWTEQGPGDEIMYANMFADLTRAAKSVAVQCSPRLAPILRRSFPAIRVFDRDLTADELEGIDFQAPAGSLGEWLRPSYDAFPRETAYLKADTAQRDALRAKYLAGTPQSLLVGISWKSANTEAAAEKSLNLLEWGPILQVPGITFVNLQYGDCQAELQQAAQGFGVRIIQDGTIDSLRDMDGFASQVAAMDIVVSSSNTAAHVAGALGVPTFCLLPASLGRGRRWYWFAEHATCPWYPAVRRFYHRDGGHWLDVIREAGLALIDAVAARGVAVAPHLRAMAQALARIQRHADAEAYYLRLAREDGLAAEAFFAIAELRLAATDADGAFAFYDRALAADPAYWHAYNGKGVLLGRLNRFDEAIAAYRDGIAQNPSSPELHNNIGLALLRLGRSKDALAHYELAAGLSAERPAAIRDSIALNHAAALHDVGRTDEAIAILGGIIDRTPDAVEAHHNRAQNLLTIGRFKEGWEESEWRLKRPIANVRYDSFPHLKRWNGEDLAGKRVLIWTEQGIGDEILAASMMPDAIARAEHATILCSTRLVPLFRRSFPTATVEERKEPLPKSARDPRLAFQMSMADLGRAFRPSFESFPQRPRFLAADDTRRKAFRAKYQALRPGTRLVGISWSSHGNPEMGWLKSNNLEAWRQILLTPGVTFVNLQYGDRTADLARVRQLFGVDIMNDTAVDAMKDIDGFAAQVAALDLVISTSNTAVHTSGGLGVPTWVLAPDGRGRHWYWFRDREDSPWYPSLRFIRPAGEGGWAGAIARCADDLAVWANTDRKNGTP